MKIKEFTRKGVRHIAFKDPTSSGCVALPLEPGESPYAAPGNTWSWNGNADAPTITPSVHGKGTSHYFVTNGVVKFCGDEPNAGKKDDEPLQDMGDLADFWKDR